LARRSTFGHRGPVANRASAQGLLDDYPNVDGVVALTHGTGCGMAADGDGIRNKAGGLTTILEKSLGAVAKGGTTPLTAVYEYAEPVTERGLVFMDTPGYDPVSATGEVAGGANLICFTTGRGSVYGCRPVPSVKLASNRETYQAMREDMDVDCGAILDGEVSVAELGEHIFQLVLDVASGRRTASEELGFGDEEFAPWQLGGGHVRRRT
jgi:altronate hydrolase